MTQQQLPPGTIAPYAGTSGWSGTDTSEERARAADMTGNTKDRQHFVLNMARQMGTDGVTVVDVRNHPAWLAAKLHHGNASSALSLLHKDDRLVMLQAKRDKCHIYVTPDNVAGRPIRARRVKPTAEDLLREGWRQGHGSICPYGVNCGLTTGAHRNPYE